MLTLKNQSLKDESKKAVENISTLSEIWDRLDIKYGNGVEIVDLVIKDIQDFTFPRQNTEIAFINLVDLLERGLYDLTAVNARSDIANVYTVNIIETKLPPKYQAKWVEKEAVIKINSNSENETVKMMKVEAVDLSECYFSSKWNEHK